MGTNLKRDLTNLSQEEKDLIVWEIEKHVKPPWLIDKVEFLSPWVTSPYQEQLMVKVTALDENNPKRKTVKHFAASKILKHVQERILNGVISQGVMRL